MQVAFIEIAPNTDQDVCEAMAKLSGISRGEQSRHTTSPLTPPPPPPPNCTHPHGNDCLMAKKQASTLQLPPALARKVIHLSSSILNT